MFKIHKIDMIYTRIAKNLPLFTLNLPVWINWTNICGCSVPLKKSFVYFAINAYRFSL